MVALTWNIEGLKRNIYSLKKLITYSKADFVFMAEPQIFQSELQYCMAPFRGEYSYELNSADKFDPELAMTRTHARGGTKIMWKSSLDRYVTVYPEILLSI